MALDIAGTYRYPGSRPDWLERVTEEVLDPDLPIIDAHHHIWNQEGNIYHLPDLRRDTGSGHNIKATVFVQAHYGYRTEGPAELRPIGETEHIEQTVRDALPGENLCAAIVGFADLMLGDRVDAVLDAHLAASPDRFRGVRHSVSRDPNFPEGIVLRPAPAGMLAEPAYRAGLERIARRGLTYDAMLYHRQISELTAAAKAVPDLDIVLDHFGCIIGVGPYRGYFPETFSAWSSDIKALAQCPNVRVKMGGMGMIICGGTYHERPYPPGSAELADAWRPLVETCIEAFGVERCMFESNFPVDKAMFSYPVLWNAFKRTVSGASPAEKAALFHDTAARFYRIAVEG